MSKTCGPAGRFFPFLLKKSLPAFLFLFFLVQPCAARINQDSLYKALHKLEPDSLMLEQYIARASDMGGDDIASVRLICDWAYENANRSGIIDVQAHALYALGRSYLIIDDYDQATIYLNRALKIAQEHKLLTTEASCYTAFGNIYSANKQYPEAKKNYIRAIGIYRSSGDTNMTAVGSFNLASLLAETKTDSNYFEESLQYLNLSLSLVTDISNPDVYINAMGLKAYLCSNQGIYDSADYFLAEARRVTEERDFDEYRPQIYFYGGTHFANTRQYDKAIGYFEKGIELSREQNSLFWAYNFYESLSLVYAARGDYKNALYYERRHKEVYDSVINEENFSKVVDLRHLYENEKKEKEIIEARRAKTISDLQLESEKKEKNSLIFLLTGTILIAALFLFLVIRLRYNIRQRKTAYARLEEKNKEIQEQSERLVKQSKEIARYQSQMNPHFVFNAMNSIQGHVMSGEKEKTLEQLQRFSRLMRQTLNNSDRELISLSTEFEFLRLYFSFEKNRFVKPLQFEIVSEADEDNTLIPPMLIQPFIENALKHAGLDQAEHPLVRLEVKEENDLLLVTVRDNGQGIKTHPALQTGSVHATEIVHSRIRLLFENQQRPVPAQLIWISPLAGENSGTEVRFYLPLISRF